MFDTTSAVLGDVIGRGDFVDSLASSFTLRVCIGEEVEGVNIRLIIEWAIDDYLGFGSGISFSFYAVSL